MHYTVDGPAWSASEETSGPAQSQPIGEDAPDPQELPRLAQKVNEVGPLKRVGGIEEGSALCVCAQGRCAAAVLNGKEH